MKCTEITNSFAFYWTEIKHSSLASYWTEKKNTHHLHSTGLEKKTHLHATGLKKKPNLQLNFLIDV